MPDLLPHRFLFRYSFPLRYEAKLPRGGKNLLALPDSCRLPDLGALDDAQPFGDVRLAWNNSGLGVSLEVRGKKQPLQCDPATPDLCDGLQVWVDTRSTQTIHRASRFCHSFCLLPTGGGRGKKEPVAVPLAIARAKENGPLCDPADVQVASQVTAGGYRLDAWLPAKALYGYDPEAQPRLGFYYFLRDAELGGQFLTVGPEFPFAYDPSLWSVLELVRS
ncbi:MAG: hypothetical protein ACT4QC_06825 [Planctomycetaceae bacterium]